MRKRSAIICAAALLLFAGACGYPGNDGHYLQQEQDDDVGIRLDTVYFGAISTTSITGKYLIFPSGAPFATSTFVLNGAYGQGMTFQASLVEEGGAGATGSLTGTAVDLDQDGKSDRLDVTATIGGEARVSSMGRVAPIAYDPYKCWDGPGKCGRGLGDLVCSEPIWLVPTDPYLVPFRLSVTMLYKQADGLPTTVAWVGDGSGACYLRPVPGEADNCGGATSTVSGTTEGSISFDFHELSLRGSYDHSRLVEIATYNDYPPPDRSNTVSCTVVSQCGDGVVQPPEQCDDNLAEGNSNAPDAACRLSCMSRRCGDRIRDPAHGEDCDDGNTIPRDGCSSQCRFEGSERAAFGKTGATVFD